MRYHHFFVNLSAISRFVSAVTGCLEKMRLNIERAHKILKEAEEQSERGNYSGIFRSQKF